MEWTIRIRGRKQLKTVAKPGEGQAVGVGGRSRNRTRDTLKGLGLSRVEPGAVRSS